MPPQLVFTQPSINDSSYNYKIHPNAIPGSNTERRQAWEGLGAHSLDNERSAILLAAPITATNTYNTNASAYKAYRFFVTAHEGVGLLDKSVVYYPNQPVSIGQHIQLGFSRAKHGTYAFNPDGLPIVNIYVIFSAYATLNFLYQNGHISYLKYLALSYLLDTAFFRCIVESFQDQGGSFSGTRVNIGELNRPINNSGFIQSPQLVQKLNRHF